MHLYLSTLFALMLLVGCAMPTRQDVLDTDAFFTIESKMLAESYVACVSLELEEKLKWSVFGSPFLQSQRPLPNDTTEISFAGGDSTVANIFIIQFVKRGDYVTGSAYSMKLGFIDREKQEKVIASVMQSCSNR